jgi:D-arginine dehydrogenase
MPIKYTDFLIVGAGIAGASVGAELAATHSVCIVDAESHAGYHATGRSAALFSEIYGNSVIRRLSRASRQSLVEPAAAFIPGSLLSRRGTLFFATEMQSEKLQDFARQEDVRLVTRELNATETLAVCPLLRQEHVSIGLYEPNSADIDVNRLHQAYLRRIRDRSGQFVTSCQVEAVYHAGGLWHVRGGAGIFAAPILINAAGAWADQIAELASVQPVGLRPLRRTVVLVDGPVGWSFGAWPLVIAIDESLYFKPDAGRLLVSPADETLMKPCDVQADEWDVAVAIDRFTNATNIAVSCIRHRWAGLRTFASDRAPVVGFDPVRPGFFWLAGQGGYGVQTAPALAILAAALARNLPIPTTIADFGIDAADLSPHRLLQTRNELSCTTESRLDVP